MCHHGNNHHRLTSFVWSPHDCLQPRHKQDIVTFTNLTDRQLSKAFLDAEHERRYLKRWRKRTGKESDQVVYIGKPMSWSTGFISISTARRLKTAETIQGRNRQRATRFAKMPYGFHTWWRRWDGRYTRKLLFETKWSKTGRSSNLNQNNLQRIWTSVTGFLQGIHVISWIPRYILGSSYDHSR